MHTVVFEHSIKKFFPRFGLTPTFGVFGTDRQSCTTTMEKYQTDKIQVLHQQWLHQDEGALVVKAFLFLDVKTLESANKIWRELCML
jgi:hypothetical protein